MIELVPTSTEYFDFRNSLALNLNSVLQYCLPSTEEGNKDEGKDTGISIYTDGFTLNNRVKGGVFSAKLDTRNAFRLPDHCHDFQAKITAIKESLLVLPKRMLTTKNIFINLGIQVALKSLNYFRDSSKTVKKWLAFARCLANILIYILLQM